MSGYDASEWREGDVAMIGWNMTSGNERAIRQYKVWETESGIRVQDAQIESARRLVVIDPEDAEQVTALMGKFSDAHGWATIPADVDHLLAYRAEQMQCALREFAAPPRIEEPQGLGAVVEDAGGSWFVKWSTHHRADRNWKRHDIAGGDYRAWDDVKAVRVLSEGVAP